MNKPDISPGSGIVPWRLYISLTVQSVLAFYIATFSLAMYFLHHGANSIILAVIQVILYVFILAVTIKRVIGYFSPAALMLTIPIVPLLAIILILSMLPILQMLQ
ncbi:MAG: hypothetical protein ACD_46C00103G0008 [uncultured bacterium]|nr:MAG: hypothetical protein ACD_46C00103G0008 [uncultured bacterium]